jgi:hypothetical protein
LSGATDEVAKLKQGYEQRLMAPVTVVLDPALTVHTPEWLWLSTGVRSVDHALEALGSLASNYFADGMAASALQLLSDGLPGVKADPSDLDARLKCQVGAWQSMIPIVGGVPMGLSHAIGHVLGGSFDVPHGYCSCVMAPAVLAFNESVNADRQARISASFGKPGERAADIVDTFITGLGMPRSLDAVGVKAADHALVAENTMHDFWARTNPRRSSVRGRRAASPQAWLRARAELQVGVDPVRIKGTRGSDEGLKQELALFKRRRIREEAAHLFFQQGYESATIDAIAESLKVTKPFIYSYYKNKGEILFDISRLGITLSLDALDACLSQYGITLGSAEAGRRQRHPSDPRQRGEHRRVPARGEEPRGFSRPGDSRTALPVRSSSGQAAH